MTPKTIHYCWYGKGAKNETILKCIQSWEKIMPDYHIKVWDESNTPFNNFPFLKLLYKQKKWSFITDFIRLYAIYKEGGIYLDTDIEVLKPFTPLLHEKVFLGFQGTLTSTKYPLNSAVIGAQKNHPFVYKCICETIKKQRLQFNAMGGPPIVSKVALQNGLEIYKKQHLKNDVLLLPTEYFYPFSWTEQFTPNCITNETYCIHWWQDSWSNKKSGLKYYIDSIKRKVEKLPIIFTSWYYYAINKDTFYYRDKL